MKSLEALCAEFIGEYAKLYPDEVFEGNSFLILETNYTKKYKGCDNYGSMLKRKSVDLCVVSYLFNCVKYKKKL